MTLNQKASLKLQTLSPEISHKMTVSDFTVHCQLENLQTPSVSGMEVKLLRIWIILTQAHL